MIHIVEKETQAVFHRWINWLTKPYCLSTDNVKKWWIWGYWFSPLMYAQNAIATNEFLGHSWSHVRFLSINYRKCWSFDWGKYVLTDFGSIQLPVNSTLSLGIQVLKSRGIFTEWTWYWIGLGAMLGYICLFNCLFTLALTYLDRECQSIHRF